MVTSLKILHNLLIYMRTTGYLFGVTKSNLKVMCLIYMTFMFHKNYLFLGNYITPWLP